VKAFTVEFDTDGGTGEFAAQTIKKGKKFFDSDEAGCDVYGSRYCGQSVRLVLVLQD